MRAHRWLGALTMCTGGLLAAVVLSAGCGGKSEDAPVVEDTAPVDTGIAVVKDTAPADTSAVDTGEEPSGSLFDADIPDIVFEGGKTAKGCYDCTIDKCKSEVAACDKDAKCRGLLLCVLTTCTSFSDTTCVIGCAVGAGVTSLMDPVVATIQSVGTCNQMSCSDKCPELPDAGMGPTDSGPKSDASSTDGSASDGSTASDGGSAPDGGGSAFAPKVPAGKHVDPKVVEILQSVVSSFAANPLARDGVVDQLSH